MDILVLTSRYTASRDIISEDFGRQTRLFEALRKRGHNIDFYCLDYRKFENKNARLHGINVFIRPFSIRKFYYFLNDLNKILKKRKYHWIIATSDPLWGIFGYIYAKRFKIRFLYDLHDNYEVYQSYKIPFFRYIDRFVIKNSDIITTVSYSLKEKIGRIRRKGVFVIHNGVDLKTFKPMDKQACRKRLNLKKGDKIIVYAGSIQKLQGVDLLIGAFKALKKDIEKLKLILVGRVKKIRDEKIDIRYKDLIRKEFPTQQGVAVAINAADVAVIPNRENAFTKYCFPYKCVEYMACAVPIVATRVGDVKKMLNDDSLCKPNDSYDLAEKIRAQLKSGKAVYRKDVRDYTWGKIAAKLDNILKIQG